MHINFERDGYYTIVPEKAVDSPALTVYVKDGVIWTINVHNINEETDVSIFTKTNQKMTKKTKKLSKNSKHNETVNVVRLSVKEA